MTKLTGLTSEPVQVFQPQLENGNKTLFSIQYRPAVQMWFIDIEYQGFALYGVRLCRSINLLRQFRHQIPFGILIDVTDAGGEPFLINDIQSGRVSIYILSEADVLAVENAITA